VRAAVTLLLIAGACVAQVYNAADLGVGSATTVLAPGARAAVSNYRSANGSGSAPVVSLLPVNSTTPFPAQVLSETSSAITFVVPNDIPPGPAQLIYKPGGQATQWTSVTIVPAALSLYRTGPAGPLIAPIIDLRGSGVASGLTRPAQPGFGVEIFGSGLGATPPSQVQVTLGGVPQKVTYVGSPSGTPGINQINFIVAPGTPDGCYVPLVLTYGMQSVSSFLSKTSDGQPCHHPWGLSTQALTQLDNGNAIQTPEIQLTTGIEAATSDRASRQESAQISPDSMNAGQIASSFVATAGNPAQPCAFPSATGVVLSGLSGGFGVAGAPAQLTDSAGTITLPYTGNAPGDSPISRLPPPVIAPLPWKFTALDSSFVPAGTNFTFSLPQPVQLAGGAPIVINHAQNSTIRWNGSDYDSSATLQLTLTAPFSPALFCAVPANSGSVTIASNLLASFRAGSSGALSVTVTEIGAGIPAADFRLGLAPVVLLAIWSSSDTRPVDFQ
jgi:uncharacterized protein (TIGR03437 family)